jgi:SAM-dependent methyltransferase
MKESSDANLTGQTQRRSASAQALVKHAPRELFVASFTLLFLELACIRWFGSTVVFLTFFTNLVLLACFGGMSVGCLCARHKRDFAPYTLSLLLISMLLAELTLGVHRGFARLNFDVGGQGSPQQIFFGTEYRAGDPTAIAIPIELIGGTFFVLIALVFVGLGQILGRALEAVPDRLRAYSIDIGGSVCGILAFGALSFFQTPPIAWFGIGTALILFLTRHLWSARRAATLGTAALVLLVSHIENLPREGVQVLWSPYYKVQYEPADWNVTTNNIGHQQMTRVAQSGAAYALPHLLWRDSGGKPFQDVLIIGAGSGNDVQGARLFEARHIDAVDIDPVIQRLGRTYHPDRPYDDPRITVHQDDGRSFLKRSARKYDLVIYALVDSLVLHSGYASLRLESYLFTQEAINDAHARLKPGGVFAMYNFFRQGWVVARLQKMAERSFGSQPLVMSLPFRARIRPQDNQTNNLFTLILAGNTHRIEDAFKRKGAFWLNSTPSKNFGINGYGLSPLSVWPVSTSSLVSSMSAADMAQWQKIAPTVVEPSLAANGVAPESFLPTDDWPFLYLREPTLPALNVRSSLLIGTLALGLLWLLSPWRGLSAAQRAASGRFAWPMFFLGAGFMLLETKSVVHMALLFGSTWSVNAIVFGAILLMILAANLFVQVARPRSSKPFFVLLLLSLLVGALVPMSTFLALPGAAKTLASCAVAFAPIFFAGVVFARAFRDSMQPSVDFGSNIAGVLVGGLCENLSLVLGFSLLLGVAGVFYVLAALLPSPSAPLETDALAGATAGSGT